MQRKDCDLSITLQNGQVKNISEKFRSKDYGDMVIELLTDGKLGWGVTGESDGICYFVPGKCYLVNTSDLKSLAKDILERYGLTLMTTVSFAETTIKDGNMRMTFKCFSNSRDGRTWKNVVVCIPWNDLQKNVKIQVKNL